MTAGYDPQAAAQQAGKNYRDVMAQLGSKIKERGDED